MKRFKTYKETEEYIFSKLPIFQRQGPKALKYDLGNIEKLCLSLGNPHNNFKSIHIAGTNGKGTTSHAIASIFQEAGYKTGLYTSPHYKDFRERIKINGKYISKQYIKSFFNNFTDLVEEIKPSYFELSVALAFSFFSDKKVDIAIIEVGLGGRLDSTNIITPLLSLITNISYDHTNTLGNTLQEISLEKAGIIKNKIPVVIGEKQKECIDSYNQKANQHNSPIYFSDDLTELKPLSKNLSYSKFDLTNPIRDISEIKTDITGPFSYKNIKYALTSIDVFLKYYGKEWEINEKHIIDGLNTVKSNTKYFGRWQLLSKSPTVIADGAHNIGAIKETFEYLKNIKFDKLHIILGVVSDKSWDNIMSILPKTAMYYFTKAKIPRAMNEVELKNKAKEYNLIGDSYRNVLEAKTEATAKANKTDLVLIIGSIYLVGEVI